ncbi:SPOR domain-containing protein [Tranquillimonas alkanivorans]|uniref:Sporulation related domain-containing protein n=1 Tax=Tranquillimonas alkanivorans TaxID=441119 RepID=A0A1I5SZR9_9RHOB|nr:SPOR domain-containing protein [Tranquillimonas alkanivorans]SFP76273.1 Sporulation related domain-containing protein [Tranquillimonas alkanivorans]
MRPRKTLALAAFVAAFAQLGPVQAQPAGPLDAPLEAPPAGFEGRQFVDSRGCVFVRATINDEVSWVPRLTAERELLCGFDPTRRDEDDAAPVLAETPEDAEQAEEGDAPDVAGTPAEDVEAPVLAETPEDVERADREDAPAVADGGESGDAPVLAETPRDLEPADAAEEAPARADANEDEAGEEAPALADSDEDREAPVMAEEATPEAPVAGTPAMPAAPEPEALPRTAAVDEEAGSKGAAGLPAADPAPRARRRVPPAPQLAWTATTPRLLIDRRTGRDVSGAYDLIYPYTDPARQARDLSAGTHVAVRTRSGQRLIVRRDRLGERNGLMVLLDPPPAPAAQAATFVQVGTFAVTANAERLALRLRKAGMPVRLRAVRDGGRGYQEVLAGPLTSGEQVRDVLRRVREAGFADAFVRGF